MIIMVGFVDQRTCIYKGKGGSSQMTMVCMFGIVFSIAIIAIMVAFFVPTLFDDILGIFGAAENLVLTVGIVGVLLIMAFMLCMLSQQGRR